MKIQKFLQKTYKHFTNKVDFTKDFTKYLQKTYQINTKIQKYKIYKNNDNVNDNDNVNVNIVRLVPVGTKPLDGSADK